VYSAEPFFRPGIQACSPQHKKDTKLLEKVQRRANKMIRRLVHISYEERLRDLGLFTLEKRKTSLWPSNT